jgi:hypothetical protein
MPRGSNRDIKYHLSSEDVEKGFEWSPSWENQSSDKDIGESETLHSQNDHEDSRCEVPSKIPGTPVLELKEDLSTLKEKQKLGKIGSCLMGRAIQTDLFRGNASHRDPIT